MPNKTKESKENQCKGYANPIEQGKSNDGRRSVQNQSQSKEKQRLQLRLSVEMQNLMIRFQQQFLNDTNDQPTSSPHRTSYLNN